MNSQVSNVKPMFRLNINKYEMATITVLFKNEREFMKLNNT